MTLTRGRESRVPTGKATSLARLGTEGASRAWQAFSSSPAQLLFLKFPAGQGLAGAVSP